MRSWAWNTATTEVESSPSTNGTAAIRIAPRTCGVYGSSSETSRAMITTTNETSARSVIALPTSRVVSCGRLEISRTTIVKMPTSASTPNSPM